MDALLLKQFQVRVPVILTNLSAEMGALSIEKITKKAVASLMWDKTQWRDCYPLKAAIIA